MRQCWCALAGHGTTERGDIARNDSREPGNVGLLQCLGVRDPALHDGMYRADASAYRLDRIDQVRSWLPSVGEPPARFERRGDLVKLPHRLGERA